MSESFSVGEIAVFHGMTRDVEYEGTECEVIGPYGVWPTRKFGDSIGWRVRTWDGRTGPTTKIRKRRPPQDWVRLCNLTDTPREVEHV